MEITSCLYVPCQGWFSRELIVAPLQLYTAECRECKFCKSGKTNLCGAVRSSSWRVAPPEADLDLSPGPSYSGTRTHARRDQSLQVQGPDPLPLHGLQHFLPVHRCVQVLGRRRDGQGSSRQGVPAWLWSYHRLRCCVSSFPRSRKEAVADLVLAAPRPPTSRRAICCC